MGAFAEMQSEYASHGIAAFPVNITDEGDKRPAIRGWKSVGLLASKLLADKFPDADALGFCPGPKSKITVLDVDSTDERVLADAFTRHGSSPLVVKTARGRFQAWYRHSGEQRKIRPWGPDVPIDLLGDGFVVAPPSISGRSRYQIIEGTLDDTAHLPTMRSVVAVVSDDDRGQVREGGRNEALFRFLCKCARSCGSLDDPLWLARDEARSYLPPLDDSEVSKMVRHVWQLRERGELRSGGHGAYFPADDVMKLVTDPHVFALLAFLKAKNKPDSLFWISDGLGEKLGWSRREFKNARQRIVEGGCVQLRRGRAPGRPALYEWGRAPSRLPSGR